MGIEIFAIGMKVDRRDCQNEIFDLVGMQRGVARHEHAALADAEQRDLVVSGFAADALDRGVNVIVDIVVDRQPAFGPGRLTPVDQPEVKALGEQTANQRSVRLQIGHGVAADQSVGNDHGCFDLAGCQRFVAKQFDLVAAHHQLLWCGADVDILVLDPGQQFRGLDHLVGHFRKPARR